MKAVKVVLLVMLFVFSMSSIAWAGWSGASADQSISYFFDNNKKAQYVRIAYDAYHGNLIAVWIQDTTYVPYTNKTEIAVSVSSDGGYNWSGTAADSLISINDLESVSTVGQQPIGIAVDSQGRIFVVWSEQYTSENEIMLSKSTDGGHTWSGVSADFPISYTGAAGNSANDPDIAVDGNDNLYVVWHQTTAVDTTEIYISKSTDAGVTWSGTSGDQIISYPDAAHGINPDIAIAPNNDIFVVWKEPATQGDMNTDQILYGKSTNGGTSFNSETADLPITTQVRQSGDPQMVIDTASNVHVVWGGRQESSTSLQIYYSRSTDGGANWSGLSDTTIVDPGDSDGVSSFRPAIGVTSAGKLIVVWNETPSGYSDAEIWASYSVDGGDNWSGQVLADIVSFPDGHGAYRPDVVAGPGDTLHVVWSEGIASSGYYDIHYSRGDTLATGGQPGCDYVPGDANGDGNVMGNDVTYSVRFFKGLGAPPPDSCWNPDAGEWLYSGGDANGNCSYTGSDVTFLVAYFKGYNLEIFYCEHTPPIGGGLSSLKAWNRPER